VFAQKPRQALIFWMAKDPAFSRCIWIDVGSRP